MAFMVFTQALFPAIVLAMCNLVLVSSLKTEIPLRAPSADAAAIIRAGATNFRSVVAPADLPGVLVAYATSVDRVFYLVAAMVVVSGVFIWGIGWQDIRDKTGGGDAKPAGEESVAATNQPDGVARVKQKEDQWV
jgi:hypothetical protein